MNIMTDRQSSRRSFLKQSATAFALPHIIPASALGKTVASAPSDRVSMGFVGMGTMGDGHLFGRAWTYLPGGYLARNDVQVLAVCDVWKEKREKAKLNVNKYYDEKFGTKEKPTCEAYNDFRKVLDRDDIDAVLIATPIHWHATMTVLAAQAGKDVYCEKPTAISIHESQAAVKAIKENKRVFQAGTQQRSEYHGNFRLACELIRNNRIGNLQEVYAYRDGGGAIWPIPSGDPKPIPADFDWDLWLGPAPKIPYQGHSGAHLFGFGGINWGQHHYDIVQWALDADRTGPVEIFIDEDHAAYRYANGVVVYGRPFKDEKIGETGGGWYLGDKGGIGVDREHLVSQPESIVNTPLDEDDVRLYHSDSHSINFLECIKTRKRCICDIETAHRAVSVLLLGGIATRLKRPLKWDPDTERFINDDEANKMLKMEKREPWVV